jgi:peptidoglycan-associated lipoprotein
VVRPDRGNLPHRKFSVSGYRRGTNYIQGYTNVGDFASTFDVGVKDRVELFGSLLFDTRIDRDTRPLFINDPTFGGIVDRYPLVHFDFDRYTLRSEATRVLDEAVTALREDPTLRVTIEGHTCNIGTAEYNLALGERRATAVRDYLVSRGVATDRLQTISYGEERPKHDNAREETRRLNRRAALVVNLQR